MAPSTMLKILRNTLPTAGVRRLYGPRGFSVPLTPPPFSLPPHLFPFTFSPLPAPVPCFYPALSSCPRRPCGPHGVDPDPGTCQLSDRPGLSGRTRPNPLRADQIMPWVVCSTDSQVRVVADTAGSVQPGNPGSPGSAGCMT